MLLLLPDEPVPVRLMNTVWADRSGVHDALTTASDLSAWLAGVGVDGPAPDAGDVQRFRALRDALRRLAALLTGGTGNDTDAAVAEINRAVSQAPSWPQLVYRDGRLHGVVSGRGDPSRRALSTIAQQSIDLLSGPDRIGLRACLAPGCVLYFMKDHPRREWCSTACGNRARVARHYRRHHRKAVQS